LVLPRSRARIVRCGGRYDPQLVKRSSEWVSEWRRSLLKLSVQKHGCRWSLGELSAKKSLTPSSVITPLLLSVLPPQLPTPSFPSPAFPFPPLPSPIQQSAERSPGAKEHILGTFWTQETFLVTTRFLLLGGVKCWNWSESVVHNLSTFTDLFNAGTIFIVRSYPRRALILRVTRHPHVRLSVPCPLLTQKHKKTIQWRRKG